jgi:hypothetical protein
MNSKGRHTMRSVCARIKLMVLVAAIGAVVTMGALTAALGGTEAPKVTAAPGGDTSTAAPPPSTPSVARAVPDVKAPGWKAHWPN